MENIAYNLYLLLKESDSWGYEQFREQLIEQYGYDKFREVQKEAFKLIGA